MTGLRRFLRPLALLRRRAVYSGLFGGNRRMLMLGGVAWGLHLLRRLFGKGVPAPVHTTELLPGERFVVVHRPAERKRSRRAG